MPRPWDNAPWRRKVMQGVLCGVLVLCVYGSWLLSRHRGAALMPSEWRNWQAGPLLVSLPATWNVRPDSNDVTADEKKPYMGVRRRIVIERTYLGSPNITPQEYAARIDRERAPEQTPEPFDFLGQHGVLYDLPMEIINPEQERVPVVMAVVVLPDGTAVVVTLLGPQVIVPADRELLKRVARSMKEINAPGHGVAQIEHPKRLAPLVSGSEDAS